MLSLTAEIERGTSATMGEFGRSSSGENRVESERFRMQVESSSFLDLSLYRVALHTFDIAAEANSLLAFPDGEKADGQHGRGAAEPHRHVHRLAGRAGGRGGQRGGGRSEARQPSGPGEPELPSRPPRATATSPELGLQ